jgi:GNAT superfamily N-acetyltransferase
MGEVTRPPKERASMIAAPVRLAPRIHEFGDFDCGKPPLNEWLRAYAVKSEGGTARTYVVCEGKRVVGYYCISAGSIERAALPTKIKKHGLPNPIPVGIIGRLARDLSYKGKGLGRDLLSDAIKRILFASETIGVRAIIVHAQDADSIPFYVDNGFLPCVIGERTFFLPLETAKAAL